MHRQEQQQLHCRAEVREKSERIQKCNLRSLWVTTTKAAQPLLLLMERVKIPLSWILNHTQKNWIFSHVFYFSIFSPHTLHSPEENPCYRCFNLQLVSKNVILLIHNEIDINSKCSSSPESVRCPEDITLTDTEPPELRSDFRSIVLFSE